MLIDAIDHVQLAMPAGGEELASWFYGEVLGVPQVPKPPHLAIRGGCWFEHGALRIHLGVQDDFVPASKAHPAFAVADLDRFEASIREHGLDARREEDPVGPPSVYVSDPFGNRLEFGPARPVAEVADASDAVVEVARASVGDDVAAIVAFAQELDRLKSVERQSFILGGLRRENSAEHSWHVALLAALFADLADEGIDVGRVVLLLLVHDVVEIDAGDTGIHDYAERASKPAREARAAERLFGLLPGEVGGRMRDAWGEYEAAATPEARFAQVFDRLSPFLLNYTAHGLPWMRWGVTAEMVRRVLAPIADGAPELWPFIEALLDRAVAERALPAGGSGIILPGQSSP